MSKGLSIEFFGKTIQFFEAGPLRPLTAIQRKYGDAVLTDLLVLKTFAGTNGADPHEFWWWPHEHLLALGKRNTPKARKSLMERIGKLKQAELKVTFTPREGGAEPITMRAPLIAFTREEVHGSEPAAQHLRLHRGLFLEVQVESAT